MILGIDLGTTNSLVSVWRDGQAELIPNGLGSVLTPSVVSLDRTGELLVGAAARERLTSHPDLTAGAFKRAMGTGRTFRLGERKFRPEELSSFVLRALKADAEAYLGAPVREAVITVPAYFNDAQRRATKSAGALADLIVERVLNEPTAAALAYGLQEPEAARDGKILVFDLGGGTFDVSVLEFFSGVMEVRATAGDNFLGGEDFDGLIAAWFAERWGRPTPDEAAADPGERREAALLREAARTARHALSGHDEVVMAAPLGGTHRTAALTEETFRALAAPLLERLRRPVARALADSRIRREELSHVVLAGGATRMPIIRSLAAQLFGRLPLHRVDPDEVVARGAAVQAGLKMRDAALAETVLTDVAPYTLGIEVVEAQPGGGMAGGRLLPIIERNTVVPVSRTTEVIPTTDFTEKVTIRVHQGESRLVADDIALGTLDLALRPRRRAEQAIEVRFTYDINGILEVTARCRVDGVAERIVITQHAGVMTPAEIEARLAELARLKLPPREAAANRLLLARAERCYEQALGEARRRLGAAIAAYEAALGAEDASAVAAAAEVLHHAIAAATP